MRRFFQRYLTIPSFANDEQRQHALLLHTLWLRVFLMLCVFTPGFIIFTPQKVVGAAFAGFMLALMPLVRLLLRRGQLRYASMLFVGLLWLPAAFILVFSGTLGSVAALGLTTTTVIGGLLLGRRAAVGLAIASGALVAGLAALYLLNVALPRYVEPTPIVSALVIVFGLYLTLVAINQSLGIVNGALVQARRELAERRRTETTLRLTLQQMGAIVWTVDNDMCVTSLQGAGLAALNLQPQQVIGRHVVEVVQYGDAPVLAALESALHGESVAYEQASGDLMYASRVEPLRDVTGQIIGAVVVSLDITESKQAQQALQATQAKYHELVELGFEAIFLVDNETGRILEANGAATELYGYSHAEFLTLCNVDLSAEPEATRAVTQTTPLGDNRIILLRYHRRKNGAVFPVEITGRFFAWQGRGVHVAAVRDITERRRAEAEREALIAELQHKNDELERFTYTVSHDLKSPLITIRGFLGFVQQDALQGRTDRLTKDISRIQLAVDRMEQMLADLLRLSRAGRLISNPERVSLELVVREALGLVHGQLAAHNIRVDVAPHLPAVWGDRARLVQVLQNLVDNAAKFCGDHPAPWIQIGMRRDGDERVFYVADNGIGLAPQYVESVFGLFEKLDRASNGSGIGLALAKRIIEVHGGRIWVESEGLGKGCTFCFTLGDAAPQPNL